MNKLIRSVIIAVWLMSGNWLNAQNLSQLDTTLNNLVHPAGYRTCEPGTPGEVKKFGSGKQAIILVAGYGFGWEHYKKIISYYKSRYQVYAVTPAGFGGTAAPPMPDSLTTYAELSWTKGIVTGILKLIEKEKLSKPIIITHFVTGTQVAFELAVNHSDVIGKVIIAGGSPYRYYATPRNKNWSDLNWDEEMKLSAEQRSTVTETWLAPKWFKMVTKKTWDDNMWTPDDYCKSKSKGKRLFDASAKVPVQVMIRYLMEWGAYDASDKYSKIKTPVLILIPDFSGILDHTDSASCNAGRAKQYLNYYHKDIWKPAQQANNQLLKFTTIAGTRLFMWYDKPRETFNAIDNFLER